MKSTSFMWFFVALLCVYSLVHLYLYTRAMQAFPLQGNSKKYVLIGYIAVASAFFIGMFLERVCSSLLSEWILKIGSIWLAFVLYFLLLLVLIDIVRVLNYFFHFLPHFSQYAKSIVGICVCVIVCVTVLIGHITALRVQVVHIPITINKTLYGANKVKILMASDLHFGAIIGESWEKKISRIVREQNPDLVLLCGDVVDGDIAPVLRKQIGKHIQELQLPLGLYAVAGNHEYIGGIDKALAYFEKINIQVLRDEYIELENGIQLIGRNDLHGQTALNKRASLDSLLENLDTTKPIIVMDHQPYNLQKASEYNIDLHLSGHTHHGQLWPLNYITNALFELSWGYRLINQTHFYVSSGFGTWGPRVRLGNKPEVVVFSVEFKE